MQPDYLRDLRGREIYDRNVVTVIPISKISKLHPDIGQLPIDGHTYTCKAIGSLTVLNAGLTPFSREFRT